MKNKLMFIDVETTGTNPEKNGIIQIGGILYFEENGIYEEKERYNFFIKPFPNIDIIEPKALEVNNTTLEKIQTYNNPERIYECLLKIYSKYVNKYDRADKFIFIGYNARFDYDFMRAWFLKNGDPYFGSWFHFPPIDVMNMAAFELICKRHELINFKLGTVAEYLGCKADGDLHDALTDILLTKELFTYFKTQGAK